MNSRDSRPKVPWSRGDKFLMLILGLALSLALGLVFWFRALDQNPNISIPTPPMPATNAHDFYIAAANAVRDDDKVEAARAPQNSGGHYPGSLPAHSSDAGVNHFSLADKEKLVAENAGAVQTLHSGFQYPYQEPPYRSLSATFPHYAKFRALARFLSLQAQVEAEKGDVEGAMSASLDSVQMGETMPRGPLIGMLEGVACQAIGRRQAWEMADHLTAAQARAAAHRLEQIRAAHVPFADTLQEEEWEQQASLLELMHRRDWPGDMLATSQPDQQGEASTSLWIMATRFRLAGKRTVMANYTRYMDQSIADARRPYAAHLPNPPTPSDPVNQILLPMFSQARLREVEADTQNALLLVTLALHAYKLDHGAYPPTLAALAPRYLQAVPADPFALSGPLRYKRTGAKYLLYSVGPDGKDDSGIAIFDRTNTAPGSSGAGDARYWAQEDSQGDIVAGVNIN